MARWDRLGLTLCEVFLRICSQRAVSGRSTGNRVCSVNIEHVEHCQEVPELPFGGRNGSSWLRFHFCEVEMNPTGSTKPFRPLPGSNTVWKIDSQENQTSFLSFFPVSNSRSTALAAAILSWLRPGAGYNTVLAQAGCGLQHPFTCIYSWY